MDSCGPIKEVGEIAEHLSEVNPKLKKRHIFPANFAKCGSAFVSFCGWGGMPHFAHDVPL